MDRYPNPERCKEHPEGRVRVLFEDVNKFTENGFRHVISFECVECGKPLRIIYDA
jgi:hypothetical protein